MQTIPKEILFENVLETLSEAIAVVNEEGQIVFSNRSFQKLDLKPNDLKGKIDLSENDAEQIAGSEEGSGGFQIVVRRLADGYRLLTVRPRSASGELSAHIILDAITTGKNIYDAAARALSVGTGWRWGAISRFTNNDTWAQVLGWWDTDHPGELFEYPLADAPCQTVARTGRFCFFQDVARKFPADDDLAKMGAKVYAGQVYSDGSGVPRGHVFVLHDSYDVNPDAVREILNLIVMLISAELKILELKVRVKLESTAARTDALTSLFNRKAFDEELARLRDRFVGGTMQNACLSMIDLDGMKRINDVRGHDAGDRLLQLFARKLSETYPRDRVYRLGGDEFALVFRHTQNNGEAAFPDVRGDMARIVQEMQDEDFPESGASAGTADMQETRGDVDELVRLADKRMYDFKNRRP